MLVSYFCVTTTGYGVFPDGQRLLMIKDNDQGMFSTRVVVLLNWAEDLKQLVAEGAGKRGN